jgi:hypothetical protein
MFIPDPNFSHPGSRGQKGCVTATELTKNLSIFNPKNVYPGSEFFKNPGSGSRGKKALDPGSGFATLEKKKCQEKSLENITAKKKDERINKVSAGPAGWVR